MCGDCCVSSTLPVYCMSHCHIHFVICDTRDTQQGHVFILSCVLVHFCVSLVRRVQLTLIGFRDVPWVWVVFATVLSCSDPSYSYEVLTLNFDDISSGKKYKYLISIMGSLILFPSTQHAPFPLQLLLFSQVTDPSASNDSKFPSGSQTFCTITIMTVFWGRTILLKLNHKTWILIQLQ